jgi:transposase
MIRPMSTSTRSTTTKPRKRTGKRDLKQLEQRRMRAAAMFADGATQAQVARELGVSAQTASRWHLTWRASGTDGLRAAERFGRPSRLTAKQWARIEGALLDGPQAFGFDGQLWTLARIRAVIAQLTGVTYDPAHVWALLRANDWTPQKPARRAAERDDDAIAGWVKTVWPQVTGGSQAKEVDCLC